MKFHATLMTFFHHETKRIPAWLRSFSLQSGKETAPGFIGRRIKSITFGTNLKYNRIDTRTFQVIQLTDQSRFHLFCGHTLKLTVHTLYPRTAEFTLWMHCLCLNTSGNK